MRYTTPTVPVYKLGGYTSRKHWHHRHGQGGNPFFTVVGYANGVPVPNPGKVPPKHGHWRISPRAAMRPKAIKSGGVMWASTLPAPFMPHTQDLPMPAPMPVPPKVARAQGRKARQAANRARG